MNKLGRKRGERHFTPKGVRREEEIFITNYPNMISLYSEVIEKPTSDSCNQCENMSQFNSYSDSFWTSDGFYEKAYFHSLLLLHIPLPSVQLFPVLFVLQLCRSR